MEATLAHRAGGQDERGQAMRAYAKDAKCRHGQIARYFGDRWPNLPCGMCDVCVKKKGAAPQRGSTTGERGGAGSASWPPEKAPIAALQIVHDLAQGYRPFALGKAGLMRALRGTPDAPIKQDRTSAFGALCDYKKSEVERLIEALLEQGYLRRDEDDEYRRLYLTSDGGRAVSSGDVDVEWRSAAASTAAPRSSRTPADLPGDVDTVLLETLKSWRRELAQADNVPPYVVFADKVLVGVAAKQPTNEFDLLEIPGIGPAKAAKYGDSVLEMVRKHRGG
jgi:ATP-dependent DNA helicase RecQ